jgi:hypothetical protein
MGCTFVLKYSKSSDGDAGAGCCSNMAATGTKASIGITVSFFSVNSMMTVYERSDCIKYHKNVFCLDLSQPLDMIRSKNSVN